MLKAGGTGVPMHPPAPTRGLAKGAGNMGRRWAPVYHCLLFFQEQLSKSLIFKELSKASLKTK